MTDRVTPIGRRLPRIDPVVGIKPMTYRDPEHEEPADEREPEHRPARPTPPPDDGLPHVDVCA